MMTDLMLVQHCSPTLAGIKTGSLFNCPFSSERELELSVSRLNTLFRGKGLRVLPLRCRDKRALMYVYRPAELNRDLSRSAAREMLFRLGYSGGTERCLEELIRRLNRQGDFPHEIGLFLGYPAEDVRGFMEKRACKCCGYWKVYGDEAAARKLFASYKKCTETYCKLYEQGRDLEHLTVAM